MGVPSKEKKILSLFLNEPTRQWHFSEIVKSIPLSNDRANYWLKYLLQQNIIQYTKPEKRMPYYCANFDHPSYKHKKKIFALEEFYSSGFLEHLSSLSAEIVVIFGSFCRSDWHSSSDIDLCIIGKDDAFEKGKYELLFQREIQLITLDNIKKAKHINPQLISNIIGGYFVKGAVQNFLREATHA